MESINYLENVFRASFNHGIYVKEDIFAEIKEQFYEEVQEQDLLLENDCAVADRISILANWNTSFDDLSEILRNWPDYRMHGDRSQHWEVVNDIHNCLALCIVAYPAVRGVSMDLERK